MVKLVEVIDAVTFVGLGESEEGRQEINCLKVYAVSSVY
jgi:hypothetical protein